MLKQRILTALILIPLTLAIIYYLPIYSYYSFYAFTGFITLYAAWEWSNLMQVKGYFSRSLYLLFIASLLIGSVFISPTLLLWVTFIWWCIGLGLIMLYPRGGNYWGSGCWVRGLMGVMVLVPCWLAINLIRYQPEGFFALVFLFVLIWGADSAAYFVGKQWGKHKLARQVSPGKSVEGFIGALIATIIIALVAFSICKIPFATWGYGVLLALVTVIFSVVGDLFESMLKRQAGLKDSGNILPGHGGLLDRIDSLTAAAPVFAFGAWCLTHFLA